MDIGQDLAEPLVAELVAAAELEAGQKPPAGPPMDQRRALSVQGSGKRRCQDVGALVVFLSYWVGMLWIAALASREGDLSRLTSGMDYDNRMCGEDRPGAQFKSLPFVYYACLVYGRHRPTVCVSECPTLSGYLVRWYNQSQIHCDSLGHRIPATTYPTIATARNCVPSAASQHGESQTARPRRQASPPGLPRGSTGCGSPSTPLGREVGSLLLRGRAITQADEGQSRIGHSRPLPALNHQASLYALVASEIDDSAFMSVMAGVYKTLKWLLAASVGAMLLAACWMASVQMLGRAPLPPLKHTVPHTNVASPAARTPPTTLARPLPPPPALPPRARAPASPCAANPTARVSAPRSGAGRLASVTVSAAIVALLALAVALLVRARYLGSAAFAQGVPALAGSLQVAVNTDMSVGLAILVGFLSIGVTVALWCGLLQRLMQAGGILQEAADAAKSLPALVLLLPPLLMLGLGLLFGYYIYIALLLASAGHTTRGLMHYEHHLQLYFVYHTAGLLWTAEALLHLSFCATSGIVVRWYVAHMHVEHTSARAPPACIRPLHAHMHMCMCMCMHICTSGPPMHMYLRPSHVHMYLRPSHVHCACACVGTSRRSSPQPSALARAPHPWAALALVRTRWARRCCARCATPPARSCSVRCSSPPCSPMH